MRLESFPQDSKVSYDGTTPVYDRLYTSAQLRAFLRTVVSSGVDGFEVTSDGDGVQVAAGEAAVAGALVTFGGGRLDVPEGVGTVRLRLDEDARAVVLEAVAGTVAPEREGGLYDLIVARTSRNGSVAVTDTRGDAGLCGQLRARHPMEVPAATDGQLGGIRTGGNVTVDGRGVASVDLSSLETKADAKASRDALASRIDAEAAARGEAIGSEADARAAADASEASERKAADAALAEAYKAADAVVAQSVADEAARAKKAEADNAEAIRAEAARAAEAEQANAGAISSESARAKAAESANSKAVSDEAQARESADDGMRSSIDTVAGNLAAETTRATKAEDAATTDRAAIRAEFANADNAEATRAKAAEKANADAVANEAKARDAADAALGKRIDDAAAETGANSADIAGIKSLAYGSEHAQLVKSENGSYSSPALDEIAAQIESGALFVAEYGVTTFAEIAQHVPNVVVDKSGTFGSLVLKDEYQAFFVAASASSGAHITYKVTPGDEWTESVVASNWAEIGDKPFSTIGAGLTVTDGTLSADVTPGTAQTIVATAPITATTKDGTVTIATDGTLATAESVASEAKDRKDADSALSDTAKGLRADVDAATKALAGKPSKTDTSMTYWLAVNQGAGKYWCRLGTLVSQGDSSTVTVHVMTGNGHNGYAKQNSEFWIYIKSATTSAAGTRRCGTTVELGANCDGVDVRVFATDATTYDVWVRLPWDYPNGSYTVQGTYRSWTPNNSKDNQAEEPNPEGQVRQEVAVRTIATAADVEAVALKVFTSTARPNVMDKDLTYDMIKDAFDHSIVIANQLHLVPFYNDGKTVAIYTGNRENSSGHVYVTIRSDGVRYGELFPKWSEVTNKPFSTIGSGLAVEDGALTAGGGWYVITVDSYTGTLQSDELAQLKSHWPNVMVSISGVNMLLPKQDVGSNYTFASVLPGSGTTDMATGINVNKKTGACSKGDSRLSASWDNVTGRPFWTVGSGLAVEKSAGKMELTVDVRAIAWGCASASLTKPRAEFVGTVDGFGCLTAHGTLSSALAKSASATITITPPTGTLNSFNEPRCKAVTPTGKIVALGASVDATSAKCELKVTAYEELAAGTVVVVRLL